MADRKRQVEQAIAESVEMSKAPAPLKPAAKTPAEKLKSFSLNQREKSEAAAPLHPRASKGQSVRKRELETGMAAGRAAEARILKGPERTKRPLRKGAVITPAISAEINSAKKLSENKGITGHKLAKNPTPYDTSNIGEKNYKTVPAIKPISADQIAAPAATKKPKPSKPKRMKKASAPQLRFRGE